MDALVIQTAAVIGVPMLGGFLAGVVWAIRLEGRQNAHEKECAQRQKNLDERHAAMTATLAHMDQKLDRLVERA